MGQEKEDHGREEKDDQEEDHHQEEDCNQEENCNQEKDDQEEDSFSEEISFQEEAVNVAVLCYGGRILSCCCLTEKKVSPTNRIKLQSILCRFVHYHNNSWTVMIGMKLNTIVHNSFRRVYDLSLLLICYVFSSFYYLHAFLSSLHLLSFKSLHNKN